MKTKQTIVIIGAGAMGSALADALQGGNYRLLLQSRDLSRAEAVAGRIRLAHPAADIGIAACPADASWEADLIILAVPHEAEAAIATHIRELVNRKVVVSISRQQSSLPDRVSRAESLQELLPHAYIVKAFCDIDAAALSPEPPGAAMRDAGLAGDDAESVDTVAALIRTAGFNPVVAGPLSCATHLERAGISGKTDA